MLIRARVIRVMHRQMTGISNGLRLSIARASSATRDFARRCSISLVSMDASARGTAREKEHERSMRLAMRLPLDDLDTFEISGLGILQENCRNKVKDRLDSRARVCFLFPSTPSQFCWPSLRDWISIRRFR